MRNFKIIAMIAILAAVFATPAFAQISPTNIATAGVFTTQVEDSMDVHNYSGVKLEKWAGFVGISGYDSISNTYVPSIGYAFKPGGLYIGLWYNGNIMNFSGKAQKDQVVSTYDIVNQIKTTAVTTTTYDYQDINSNNSIQALVGVAGMGIKVGFKEVLTTRDKPSNFTSTTTENILNTTVTYTNNLVSYSYERGTLTPSVEWGMSLGKIRPKVGVEFEIGLDNETRETRADYSEQYGLLLGGTKTTSMSAYNRDYLLPRILAGVEVDISEAATVGFNLGVDIGIFDKSYSVYGHSGNVTGSYRVASASSTVTDTLLSTTTVNTATINIVDGSRYYNTNDNDYYDIGDGSDFGITATPSFKHESKIDNLTLGVLVEVPVTFSVSSYSDEYSKTLSTTRLVHKNETDKHLNTTTLVETVNPSDTYDVTRLNIAPSIGVGAVFDLIPNRFAINAGIKLNPFNFTSSTINYSSKTSIGTTTTTVKDYNGNIISKDVVPTGNNSDVTDSSEVEDSWSAFNVGARAGFTFNFNNKMAVDMVASSSNFNLNLTSVSVLFSFLF